MLRSGVVVKRQEASSLARKNGIAQRGVICMMRGIAAAL